MSASVNNKERIHVALRAPSILSLCSGIGGLDLGIKYATQDAAQTVVYVEREAFCADVLAARMGQGLDDAVVWDDLKSFDGEPWRGIVDCIIGGYPCQPFSAAGLRLGTADPRHLWPYILRHIETIEPALCFFENVPGHLTLGFEQVCQDLQRLGYSIEAGIFSAAECGAPHLRKRLFFLAYTEGSGRETWGGHGLRVEPGRTKRSAARQSGTPNAVANPVGIKQQGRHDQTRRAAEGMLVGGQGAHVANADGVRQLQQEGRLTDERRWPGHGGAEPSAAGTLQETAIGGLGRGADGTACGVDLQPWGEDWEQGVPRVAVDERLRSDRLRALGNAVVPQTAELAWATLAQRVADRLEGL